MKSSRSALILALSAAAAFFCHPVQGHDFSAKTKDGRELFFNVTDTMRHTVEVTFSGPYNRPDESALEGDIQIPASVSYDGRNYLVSSIGPSAFSGLDRITSVELLFSVVSIGEYAFAGCTSLGTVVFPARGVQIEATAFRGCTGLDELSFGSSWKELDFRIFRASRSLSTVTIPASVVKITGLRFLSSLEEIKVEEGNSRFSSHDGILYSADGKALYTCPSAKSGAVTVPEGCESVLRGAFDRCLAVTEIDFPSTMTGLEYAEFDFTEGESANLKKITFRAPKPFVTAICDGREVFALKVGKGVSVFVPKAAVNDYKSFLSNEPGVYQTTGGNDKEVCTKSQLLQPSEIRKLTR